MHVAVTLPTHQFAGISQHQRIVRATWPIPSHLCNLQHLAQLVGGTGGQVEERQPLP